MKLFAKLLIFFSTIFLTYQANAWYFIAHSAEYYCQLKSKGGDGGNFWYYLCQEGGQIQLEMPKGEMAGLMAMGDNYYKLENIEGTYYFMCQDPNWPNLFGHFDYDRQSRIETCHTPPN